MTASTHEPFDVYTSITNQIITAIEAGAVHPQIPGTHRARSSNVRSMSLASVPIGDLPLLPHRLLL